MLFFRKYSLLFTFVVLFAFTAAFVAEAFHHHPGGEKKDHCSFCALAQAVPDSPPPCFPTLFVPLLLIFFSAVIEPILFLALSNPSSGRSPPFTS
jgi:hypothetical protein